MVMVDQFCQAYHWSLKDVLKLTMPQIIMLSHAGHCNYQRIKTDTGETKTGSYKLDDNGNFIDQMSSDELTKYYTSW